MNDAADTPALLRRYTREGSEAAFRALVERHAGMVHAAARRKLNGNEALAADVTQAVFTELARRAAGLRPDTVLSAWLHRVACTQAALLIRGETRRQEREATAAMMIETNARPDDEAWSELAPLLDDALDRLPAPERTALILRFFETRDLRSVGAALGTTEEAARKRVTRALEKLRVQFARRGIVAPGAAALAALLTAHGTEAAVPGLTEGLSRTALIQATASGSAAAATSLTALITMKIAPVAAALAAFTVPAAWPLGPTPPPARTAQHVSPQAPALPQDPLLARLASGIRSLKPQGSETALLELALLISDLAPAQFDAAQALITAGGDTHALLLRSLFARRAAVDLPAAVEAAEALANAKNESNRTFAWLGLLSVWMQADPQAALARLGQLEAGLFREATSFSALKMLAVEQPQRALDLLGALPPDIKPEPVRDELLNLWAQRDTAAARAWLDARTPDDQRETAARRFIDRLSYQRADISLALALQEPDFHVRKDCGLFAVQQLAVSDPARAIEALRTLPEELRSDIFGYNTGPHFAGSAPQLLRELVHEIPSGKYRDGLLQGVMNYPDPRHPREDIEAVALHSEAAIRDSVLTSRYEAWQKQDAAAARAWLESAALPPDVKQKLRRP